MYFAALLARTEDGWEASDTELDDVETLSDLADLAREAAVDDDTVLAFIEQEDAWFGVVRVDGEEDPRIYVSDAAAAARSSYGEICSPTNCSAARRTTRPTTWTAVDLDGTEDGEPERTTTRTTTTPEAGRLGRPRRAARSATPTSWPTSGCQREGAAGPRRGRAEHHRRRAGLHGGPGGRALSRPGRTRAPRARVPPPVASPTLGT